MANVTVESILAQVNQLPALERAKLIAKLNREVKAKSIIPEGRVIRTNAPYIDRTQEFEWMRQHEREYIGQWVALMGSKLIAHGPVAKEVFAQAKALGHPQALVYLVTDPDVPYMGA